ncbi:hypothetical protein [Halapricum hydrolyticum]|uniref:Uncharacterized protein n=1 Tax=Halapricum hydrolyticum TaxID=2979991 RepID=A0AAE3IB94_9EURY|nr:hypothetical protein [Halapricum hydrolyticum]MCU4717762.1 hypothetical protein [Halapricum hydrolyticum]MCU4726926.1 hypothetical protein [Halapricum hydrolyticum]
MLDIGPLAVEWLAAGAIVAVLGGLVKFVGWTWLLAGYSESTSPVPDDVVRDIAGNTLLRVGIAVAAIGVLSSVTDPPSYFGLLVEAAILVAVLRMFYQLYTWTPTQTA